MTTHFIWDMDGVLSVFDEGASKSKPFNQVGLHYFQTVEPDKAAISLLKQASKIPNSVTKILTRVWLDINDPEQLKAALQENIDDKRIWCQRFIGQPWASTYGTLTMTETKSDILKQVPVKQRKNYILIDDDPKILQDWVNTGGTGIQWLQPNRTLVSPWRQGPVIGPDMPLRYTTALLYYIAKHASRSTRDTF